MSQFEVGKTYRMRGGGMAYVEYFDGDEFVASGYFYEHDGTFCGGVEKDKRDLIPGAIEDEAKPSIPQTDYAFPFTAPDATFCGGMLLRDWFAGQALAGMVGKSTMSAPCDDYADKSYRLADAMMKARGK